MRVILQLTPRDPLVARDGRPFGINQGQRMRGLPWPLPSVVAGSFRTALVKAGTNLDFSGDMPQRLMGIAVGGVFPVHEGTLYLPAPNDAVAEPLADGKGIKEIHRVVPQLTEGGCDFPHEVPLLPVMLSESQARADFKPAAIPHWWPVSQLTLWLKRESVTFDSSFLGGPRQELRDHVCLDADRGAAAEGLIFATAGLNVTHLPRFGRSPDDKRLPFDQRFAEVTLTARVTIGDAGFAHLDKLDIWHPLGGERRLVHWQPCEEGNLWDCPNMVKQALDGATQIRMVLATPAIFKHGWRPGWLNGRLEGSPPGTDIRLQLIGVSNGRWKAVSGWSMQPHRETGLPGPKAIRRMVPAGSVYFFRVVEGASSKLADCWLHSVSDAEQDQRDGFGLAVWGVW